MSATTERTHAKLIESHKQHIHVAKHASGRDQTYDFGDEHSVETGDPSDPYDYVLKRRKRRVTAKLGGGTGVHH